MFHFLSHLFPFLCGRGCDETIGCVLGCRALPRSARLTCSATIPDWGSFCVDDQEENSLLQSTQMPHRCGMARTNLQHHNTRTADVLGSCALKTGLTASCYQVGHCTQNPLPYLSLDLFPFSNRISSCNIFSGSSSGKLLAVRPSGQGRLRIESCLTSQGGEHTDLQSPI